MRYVSGTVFVAAICDERWVGIVVNGDEAEAAADLLRTAIRHGA